MYSDGISEILKFFKIVKDEKNIAEMTLSETNDELQDLYHELEFKEHTYHGSARIAKEITKVRKERRIAKYTIEQHTPIVDWLNSNQRFIRDLENLLGVVRKAESHTDPDKLIYTYKTNIINEMFNTDSIRIEGVEKNDSKG